MKINMKIKGFTLIELLIVVAIIAILAAIAVPNFLEAQTRAKVSRCVADMRSIAIGIESYIVDHNNLPIPNYYSTWTMNNGSWITDYLMLQNFDRLLPGTLLTTPVAYLTSIPFDVFNTRMLQPYWTLGPTGRGASVVISGVPLKFDTSTRDYFLSWWKYGSRDVPTNWRYVLESCGPDGKWWRNQWNRYAAGSWFYDPTNGTVSEGQILYFQGGGIYPRR